MFCGKCGASNSETAQFCASCGAQLSGGVQPGSAAPPVETAPDNRKRNRTIGIVVTVVVLLAVAVGAFLLIRGGKSYEKQLVGIWVDEDGDAYEFCSDGTYLEEGMALDDVMKWSIVNGDTIEFQGYVDGEHGTWQHKILSLQGDRLTMHRIADGYTWNLFRSFEALREYEYAGRD